MISPFNETLPSFFWVFGCSRRGLLLFSFAWSGRRINSILHLLKQTRVLFPKWIMLLRSGTTSLIGGLLINTRFRLIPFGLTLFHYPTLGVGLSLSFWIILILLSISTRASQFIKEYFNDPSLPAIWAILCILVERGSRIVRAVTLGGRIRVNIIIGSILFRVIGEMKRRWGLFILTAFEGLVVIVQSYVFILLICLYVAEREYEIYPV